MNIKFYKNFQLPEFRLTDLLRFFTRDEIVVGLEISECFLRLAILELEKTKNGNKTKNKKQTFQLRGIGEKSLKLGTIEDGEVKDKKALIEALKSLFGKAGIPISYVVASIPSSLVYSKVYSFPQTVAGEKLEEAMKLIIGFQLPFKAEDIYLDWEKTETGQSNEALLAIAHKRAVDKYIEALAEAGLKTVAVEFYGTSIARSINLKNGESALVLLEHKDGTQVHIVKKHIAKFSRFLPVKFSPDKKSLKGEAEKIVSFFEAEDKTVVSYFVAINEADKRNLPEKLLPSMKAEEMIAGDFVVHPDIKNSPEKWLISSGAVIRGLLPRSEDNHISLMPMGTEEAYEKQKAVSSMKFLSSLVIGFCAFLVFAFVGVLAMMMSIESGFNKRLSVLNSLMINNSGAVLEQRAEKLNNFLAKAKTFLDFEPKWSEIVADLRSQVSVDSGITINNFSISPDGYSISLSGVSKNKTSLNSFKKKMDDSGLFSEIILPPIGLFQVDNIPFSLGFKFKKVPMISDKAMLE